MIKLINGLYVSCHVYSITNLVVFEFVIFDIFIIRVVFELTNTIKYLYIETI